VASAKDEVAATGDKVREKLDLVDQVIASPPASPTRSIEDRGTLGRLVNDPTIADNVEEITDDAKGFLGTLFKMQTYVGLRSEYNVFAGLARHYMSVELHTRPDKFYLIELEKGPRGGYPDTAGVRPDQRRRPVGAHERRSPTSSASRSSSPSASTG
jgi:hypothetical protein